MFSFIKKFFVKPVEYKTFSADERLLEREKIYELIKNAKKEIWIVADEPDPFVITE